MRAPVAGEPKGGSRKHCAELARAICEPGHARAVHEIEYSIMARGDRALNRTSACRWQGCPSLQYGARLQGQRRWRLTVLRHRFDVIMSDGLGRPATSTVLASVWLT